VRLRLGAISRHFHNAPQEPQTKAAMPNVTRHTCPNAADYPEPLESQYEIISGLAAPAQGAVAVLI